MSDATELDFRQGQADGESPAASHSWPIGGVTGIGSMPGFDPVAACRLVFDLVSDFPYLPELPARGPWADTIGRASGVLVDLPLQLTSFGWQLAARPGADVRRARAFLDRDLDAVAEAAQDYEGPIKIQICGPWTLAASTELRHGDKVVTDERAVRDVAQSLGEGIRQHIAALQARVPSVNAVVQLDEPMLPAVLGGTIRAVVGTRSLPPVEESTVEDVLRRLILDLEHDVVVHSCGSDPPLQLLHQAGARGVSLDATSLTERLDEAIGEAVEAGIRFFLGLVPVKNMIDMPDARALVDPAVQLMRRIGLPPATLSEMSVVTPTCGLAGSTIDTVAQIFRQCRKLAEFLTEDPGSER